MSNNDHDHSVNSKHAPVSHFAVPFVTWGGACSGISLFVMGKGHPDSNDDRMVGELVNHVYQKLHSDTPKGIKPADLAYQSKENHLEMEKVSLEVAKADMPRCEIDIHKYFCRCYSYYSRISYYNPKTTVPKTDMIKSIIMKMQSNIKSTIVSNIFPTLSSAVIVEKFLSFFNGIK
ncbi:MAG: hypothetical protein U9N83_17345 [Thermodesulfobacteriota bacterium]|nr:hypothetical protein [Thermodesulfobacteriota bacterium]